MSRSVCPGFGSVVVITEPLRPAERVDAQLRRAGDAAQVAVVGRLDAALADLVAGLVALALRASSSCCWRDLADVAEQLRRERVVRVVAEVRRARVVDARELVRVLVEVVDRAPRSPPSRTVTGVSGSPRRALIAARDLAERHLRQTARAAGARA